MKAVVGRLLQFLGNQPQSSRTATTSGVSGTPKRMHLAGGSQSSTKEVLINGTSGDSATVGFVGAMEPPMDAVGQFHVDTAGISAAAGRTDGGGMTETHQHSVRKILRLVYGTQNRLLVSNSVT